jgi:hypothetical protein
LSIVKSGDFVIRHIVVIAVLGCLAAGNASAQDAGRTRVFAAAGVGAGIPSSGGDGIANMGQLVFQKNAHHVALRGFVLHDLDRTTNEMGEVGILYGRARVKRDGYFAVAGGVSFNAFDTCPDDDDSCFTFGVPLVAEAALNRGAVGLGVQAFGNLNAKASYGGAVLFVQLGRL